MTIKKRDLTRYFIIAACLVIITYILIPSVGGASHPPNYQIVAHSKLRSLSVLYATYTTSGARVRPLQSLEDLKDLAIKSGGDLSIFSTYDPLNKRETPVLYFKPTNYTDDQLVFVFKNPILRLTRAKEAYTEEGLKNLRYMALYTRSGVKRLEEKPIELSEESTRQD